MTKPKDRLEAESPDFPQRSNLLQFPAAVLNPDGFLESRLVGNNKRGQSVTLTFKLRPEEARELEIFVEEYRDDGYRTVSDVLRHAVREHIPRLLQNKKLKKRGVLDNTWAMLRQMLEDGRNDLYCAKWGDALVIAEDYISRCQSVGARGAIVNKLNSLRANVGSVHHEFWRGYWDKEIMKRWGQYL